MQLCWAACGRSGMIDGFRLGVAMASGDPDCNKLSQVIQNAILILIYHRGIFSENWRMGI